MYCSEEHQRKDWSEEHKVWSLVPLWFLVCLLQAQVIPLYLTSSFSVISYFGSFMDRSLTEMIDIVSADPENEISRNRLDDLRVEEHTNKFKISRSSDF
jgi:hypothetical protein